MSAKLNQLEESLADNVTRLQQASEDIKASLEAKGVTVTGGFSTFSEAIDKIKAEPTLQTKTVHPSKNLEIVSADPEYDGLDVVKVTGVFLSGNEDSILQSSSVNLFAIDPTTGSYESIDRIDGTIPTRDESNLKFLRDNNTIMVDPGYYREGAYYDLTNIGSHSYEGDRYGQWPTTERHVFYPRIDFFSPCYYTEDRHIFDNAPFIAEEYVEEMGIDASKIAKDETILGVTGTFEGRGVQMASDTVSTTYKTSFNIDLPFEVDLFIGQYRNVSGALLGTVSLQRLDDDEIVNQWSFWTSSRNSGATEVNHKYMAGSYNDAISDYEVTDDNHITSVTIVTATNSASYGTGTMEWFAFKF